MLTKKTTLNKKLILILLVFSLLINLLAIFSIVQSKTKIKTLNDFEKTQQVYPFLSKRILQEFPQDILINFLDLRKTLKAQVAPYGDTFGFYFEYLPTGTSIGVNEKNEFYAASLFKVPATMAYYHLLERTNKRSDLEREVTIEEDDIDSQYGSLWKKGTGNKIKISEAVRLALEESDNTAAHIIAKRIDEEDFQAVYQAIDIDLQTGGGGALLTTKSYTSILKSLYFSASLNKEDSNQILYFLAHSKFNDKLPAGVPSGVLISHKIGDYRDLEKPENRAFTDCGIVYIARRPYALCMISISDEETARERMKLLSKTVYDYVSTKE